MKFSEIIKEIRQENQLSQSELAKLLNVNQTTISQWEAENKKPSYDNILSIYCRFGISPNELLGIEEPRKFKIQNITNNFLNNQNINIKL